MKKKYVVSLSAPQREHLLSFISAGTATARSILRARILLKTDIGPEAPHPPMIDKEVAEALDCSATTVQRVRQRFCEQGLEAALERSMPDRIYKRAFDGRAEAQLIALACSTPPEGQSRWTLRLLADRVVELGIVEKASHETVRQTLKKTNSSPI